MVTPSARFCSRRSPPVSTCGSGTSDWRVRNCTSRASDLERPEGGHDIPEATIRARYDRSRINFIELMPGLAELRVLDNSVDADPYAGRTPQPLLVLHVANQAIVEMIDLAETPRWARPLVAAAAKRSIAARRNV